MRDDSACIPQLEDNSAMLKLNDPNPCIAFSSSHEVSCLSHEGIMNSASKQSSREDAI